MKSDTLMGLELLKKHKFQFIAFCPVVHKRELNSGNVQLNDDTHILHIVKGRTIINADGHVFSAEQGDVVAIPPFVPFSMHILGYFEMINIHYRVWLEDGTLFDDVKRLPWVFSPPYSGWLFSRLRNMRDIKLDTPDVPLDALAHEVILKHLAEAPLTDTEASGLDSRLRKAVEYLESPDLVNFDSEELASVCCLSKSQMNRNFRKFFKTSPLKYWERQRLKRISLELKNLSKAIYEISQDAGFQDQGYFCRWFKKMTKCTPAEYRKKLSSKDILL